MAHLAACPLSPSRESLDISMSLMASFTSSFSTVSTIRSRACGEGRERWAREEGREPPQGTPPPRSSFKKGSPEDERRAPRPAAAVRGRHCQTETSAMRGQRPAIAQVSALQRWPVPGFRCPVRETRPSGAPLGSPPRQTEQGELGQEGGWQRGRVPGAREVLAQQ